MEVAGALITILLRGRARCLQLEAQRIICTPRDGVEMMDRLRFTGMEVTGRHCLLHHYLTMTILQALLLYLTILSGFPAAMAIWQTTTRKLMHGVNLIRQTLQRCNFQAW